MLTALFCDHERYWTEQYRDFSDAVRAVESERDVLHAFVYDPNGLIYQRKEKPSAGK